MCCLVIVFLYKVKCHWNVRLLRVSGILLLGSWIATCMAIFYLLKYSNLDILITRCLELSNKVRGLVLWEWLHGAMNMPEICRQFWNKQVKFRYSVYAKKDVHQFLFGLHFMLLKESFFLTHQDGVMHVSDPWKKLQWKLNENKNIFINEMHLKMSSGKWLPLSCPLYVNAQIVILWIMVYVASVSWFEYQ